ncbi:MAG: HAD family hydrolase [Proteobacteria bacterium]|nr:HAD family hydrolase [Pseudomonadota bacterium]
MTDPGFKAIIFDLDGTLLDSLDELGILCNRVLETNGYHPHPMAAYRIFVGDGAETLIRRALGEKATLSVVHKCLEEFLCLYRDECGKYACLYQDIPELLHSLHQHGFALALLSNKPHDLTVKNISLFLPDIPFQVVFGQRDGIPKKPDPHAVFEILNILGLRPDQCLYLGDTAVDMQTAVSASLYPVGVLWGFRSEKELKENGARSLIARPLELLDLIKSLMAS